MNSVVLCGYFYFGKVGLFSQTASVVAQHSSRQTLGAFIQD